MRHIRKHLRLLAVATSCAALGAGASAIATASAAGPSAQATAAHTKHHRRLLARAVHAKLVVAVKGGFVTVTLDRGVVESVSGRQLTLREGTKKTTYRMVTLTIPAGARVRDNGHPSALSAVTPGQRATVIQARHRTLVLAHTPRS